MRKLLVPYSFADCCKQSANEAKVVARGAMLASFPGLETQITRGKEREEEPGRRERERDRRKDGEESVFF